MFLLVPACPYPELDPSLAHLIGRGNDLGQATGDAEGDWRYEGAEPDARGLAREAGEGRPRVRRGSACFTRKRAVVVGSEVRLDACLFGGPRQCYRPPSPAPPARRAAARPRRGECHAGAARLRRGACPAERADRAAPPTTARRRCRRPGRVWLDDRAWSR